MSGFHYCLYQTEDPPFQETGKKPLSNKGLKKPTLYLSYLARAPEGIFTSRFLRSHLSSLHGSIVVILFMMIISVEYITQYNHIALLFQFCFMKRKKYQEGQQKRHIKRNSINDLVQGGYITYDNV
ncbi:hypothetical protein BDB01DRAFT_832562 [Pilobolus umbonatus]|nr:hypothetical protein BDB01DRAFT_832562 [Pilobolus umbonatus]